MNTPPAPPQVSAPPTRQDIRTNPTLAQRIHTQSWSEDVGDGDHPGEEILAVATLSGVLPSTLDRPGTLRSRYVMRSGGHSGWGPQDLADDRAEAEETARAQMLAHLSAWPFDCSSGVPVPLVLEGDELRDGIWWERPEVPPCVCGDAWAWAEAGKREGGGGV